MLAGNGMLEPARLSTVP